MQVSFKIAGDNSVILYTDEVPTEQSIGQLKAVVDQIRAALNSDLIDITPSYQSVLITFNALTTDHPAVINRIQSALNEWKYSAPVHTTSKIIRLPIFYDDSVGPDLVRIAQHHNSPIEDVVTRHCMNIYTIFAIGFAPGFAYLGHVDDEISMPRLTTPRAKVPKGSVGIADHQTAIYPTESPGGWNIIGRCPSELFNPANNEGLPFSVGDRVQFMPILKDEFIELGGSLEDF
jgi:KipI family sensor histidine kinase inhibitor